MPRRYSELTLRGLCQGHEEDIFPTNGRPRTKEIKAALCPSCPVRQQCLEWALDSPWEPWGMWAGLDQAEVRALWVDRHPGRRMG